MKRWLACGIAVAAALVAGAAPGGAGEGALVKVEDRCDPETFNEALGDGACLDHGRGTMTFEEVLAEFEEKEGIVGAWRFNNDSLTIKRSDTLTVANIGGEFHTFTRVAAFGGGFVEELNTFAGQPRSECLADPGPNNVFLGRANAAMEPPSTLNLTGSALGAGTFRFQCCIHPWMRTVLTVK